MDSMKLAARCTSALVLSFSLVLIGTFVAPPSQVERPAVVAPQPPDLGIPEQNPVPDGGRAVSPADSGDAVTIWDSPPGTLVLNPASGRQEILDPLVAKTAVLFGDSQSAGAKGVYWPQTWVSSALAARGYTVNFKGAGGTGYVAATPTGANYLDTLVEGHIKLPYGNAALVVIQGGGNDAGKGVSDAQILANAERLLRELKASYPKSEFLIIGTLTKTTNPADRRVQVDELMAGFAQRNGLKFISPKGWITTYKVTDKMADTVHLNASGHKELANVLAGKMAELGLAPAH